MLLLRPGGAFSLPKDLPWGELPRLRVRGSCASADAPLAGHPPLPCPAKLCYNQENPAFFTSETERRLWNMMHHNPLLSDKPGQKKFITMGEIMLRLTPPN